MQKSDFPRIPIWIFLIFSVAMYSCRSQKDITFFQERISEDSAMVAAIGTSVQLPVYEPRIKHNDILKIYISSINREASIFFNPLTSSESKVDDTQAYGYLVDAQGRIEMPVIGTVAVGGLTISQIRDTLKMKLSSYLESPTVRVFFDNFKVSVLGEVTHPGVYTVYNERLTIPEAIGLAGDLTIYAQRKNILVIREDGGQREFGRVDLSSREVFDSPYYYLHPNDIIYVEPGRGKTALSDNFYRIVPIVLSTLTLISVLIIRFERN